jgi:hypothetical protein
MGKQGSIKVMDLKAEGRLGVRVGLSGTFMELVEYW